MTIFAFICGLILGAFSTVLILGILAMASGPEMQRATEEMLELAALEGPEH